jgi:hypothetical protein
MNQFTRRRHGRVWSAALETMSIYLFVCWAYVAIIAILHPYTLNLPIWHGVKWLRRDTFGAVAFVGSFVSYLLLQLTCRGRFSNKHGGPQVPK